MGLRKSKVAPSTIDKPRIIKRRSSLIQTTLPQLGAPTVISRAQFLRRVSMDRVSPIPSLDERDRGTAYQYERDNGEDEGSGTGPGRDRPLRANRRRTDAADGGGARLRLRRYGNVELSIAGPPTAATATPAASVSAGRGRRRRATICEDTQADTQAERRASIQSIMTNTSLNPLERRQSIQHLMDGRRSTIDYGASNPYLAYKAKQAEEVAQREKEQEQQHEQQQQQEQNTQAHHIAPPQQQIGRQEEERCPWANGAAPTPTDMDISDDNFASDDDDSDGANDTAALSAKKNKHPYAATTTVVPAVAACSIADHTKPSAATRRGLMECNRRAILSCPPCEHYDRNCHIVSPCCGATFGCRICHDDCPILPPLLDAPKARQEQRCQRRSSMPSSFSGISAPEHHTLDRFAIQEIICQECFTRQSSKSNNCSNCNLKFGEYHCAICNLWMSNEERPYHCPDCGFCRVGGGENFRHCQDCGMCIDRQLFPDHNCKVGKYMSNCPVCQEDLFSSRDASHELPCGHAIHWKCFRELANHDSRCPCCKKTAETHERMKPTWDAMAASIAMQPVPAELAKAVTVKCNDCERVQKSRSWHFLGVQCRQCESFNTVVERITMMGPEAHNFLLQADPPQQQMVQEAQWRQHHQEPQWAQQLDIAEGADANAVTAELSEHAQNELSRPQISSSPPSRSENRTND